ncbi:MAG: electron transport complex subunit RsxB [Pseudohongiellaceae bacterium]
METAAEHTNYFLLISSSFIFMMLLIGYAIGNRIKLENTQQRDLIDRVNRLLPQTQCGQCGFEGCRPYARAIVQGEAINQCPPGGSKTIANLAALLNEEHTALNPAHGQFEELKVATIREAECIGCTKCIKACPVDAILGGPKLMHTVIASECTGCDLCIEPCPVDCIDMISAKSEPIPAWNLLKEISNPHQLSEPNS